MFPPPPRSRRSERQRRNGIRITPRKPRLTTSPSDRKDIPGYDANWKMNPPLRGVEDREALLPGLADGTIDAIATDHAPSRLRGKRSAWTWPLRRDRPRDLVGRGAHRPVPQKDPDAPQARRAACPPGPPPSSASKTRELWRPAPTPTSSSWTPTLTWTPAAPFFSKSRNTPFAGRGLEGPRAHHLSAGRVVHAL